MHKKQKITTALTVNFNKEFNRDYCERKMRIVFAKANRKLFGRRHKFIKGFGNWELTKVGNIHVHYAIACPARYMSRFVKITNDVLNEIANSSSIHLVKMIQLVQVYSLISQRGRAYYIIQYSLFIPQLLLVYP